MFFLINSGLNLVPDLNADLKKSIKKCLNEAEQSKEMFESRLNQKAAEILEKTTQIEYKIIKRSDELIESINQDRKILLDDLSYVNKEVAFKLNDQLKNFKIEFSFNEYHVKLNDNFDQLEKTELENLFQNLSQTRAELDSKISGLDKMFNNNIKFKVNSNIKQNMIGALLVDQVDYLFFFVVANQL